MDAEGGGNEQIELDICSTEAWENGKLHAFIDVIFFNNNNNN